VVHADAFPIQQHMQSPIAKPPPLARQRPQPRANSGVITAQMVT